MFTMPVWIQSARPAAVLALCQIWQQNWFITVYLDVISFHPPSGCLQVTHSNSTGATSITLFSFLWLSLWVLCSCPRPASSTPVVPRASAPQLTALSKPLPACRDVPSSIANDSSYADCFLPWNTGRLASCLCCLTCLTDLPLTCLHDPLSVDPFQIPSTGVLTLLV